MIDHRPVFAFGLDEAERSFLEDLQPARDGADLVRLVQRRNRRLPVAAGKPAERACE